ncbi:MAG TPA: hypothetical protein DEB25_06780 [Desulfobulbaceae bacterium]|nr:hypothetical protein [Desulfobulbaceae bacterium]
MGKIKYNVTIKKRTGKNLDKMQRKERIKFNLLVDALEEGGPVRSEWMNYSKLSATEYHCHLSYHWVACWRHEAETIEIEVYYVGSRENAPY